MHEFEKKLWFEINMLKKKDSYSNLYCSTPQNVGPEALI